MTGTTFSRVSYDIPGSYQRFARARAYRDAEDRACQEVAERIQIRLASFFSAGSLSSPVISGVRTRNLDNITRSRLPGRRVDAASRNDEVKV